MPLLAGLLGSGLSGLVAFFAAVMTKRAAIASAVTLFIIAGIIGIQLAIFALWTAVGFVVPPSLYGALAMVKSLAPSNAGLCISALISARVVVFVWREQEKLAKMISFIT